MAGRRKGLSPAKLEQAAYSVTGILRSLKADATRSARMQLLENFVLGVVVLVVAVFGVVSAWGKREDPPDDSPPGG